MDKDKVNILIKGSFFASALRTNAEAMRQVRTHINEEFLTDSWPASVQEVGSELDMLTEFIATEFDRCADKVMRLLKEELGMEDDDDMKNGDTGNDNTGNEDTDNGNTGNGGAA